MSPKDVSKSKGMHKVSSTPRLSIVSYTPIGISIGEVEKRLREQDVAAHGLGVITAAIFLAGEMAGSGVLALPSAMVGTGWGGAFLIFMFTANACFSGTRLGSCWTILEERYEEFQREIRDPYPSIGEKAVGRWGRLTSVGCICFTLYGAGTVFIVLIAQLLGSLLEDFTHEHLGLCQWMVIIAVFLIPLTWLGSPKDFWLIAVGALLSTVTACGLIMIQALLDHSYLESKMDPSYQNPGPVLAAMAENMSAENSTPACTNRTDWFKDFNESLVNDGNDHPACGVRYPTATVSGTFKAFASIMFAFAGASTFPTIQADMKEKEKFNTAAYIACIILGLIYVPMGVVGYFSLGAEAASNVVLNLSPGPVRIVIEIMLLLHLISAFPILINPPCQYFEQLFSIPSEFNWKRCTFRSMIVLLLLFIAETIPNFGSILDLVGSCSVTLLTFVFPPFFYMKLCDSSSENKEWTQRVLPLWERIYCWVLIVIGVVGGASATVTAVYNIIATDFSVPCYVLPFLTNQTMEVAASH